VRYRGPDGTHHRRTFETKQQAVGFRESTRTDIRRGDYHDPKRGRVAFRVVAEQWLQSRRAEGRKPKTVMGYEAIYRHHLLPEFGDRAIGCITSAQVTAFVAGLRTANGDPMHQATVRNIVRVLSPIFDLAVEERLIVRNPCVNGKGRTVGTGRVPKREPIIIDEEQIAALADAIHSRYRTFILTAAYTGMRQGELHALRVRHV
jgi:integrase